MVNRSSDWQISWNENTLESAASLLIARFGNEAQSAVWHCIEAARAVGRKTDLHFWQAVLDKLGCDQGSAAEFEERPLAVPTPSDWRKDGFLSRISSESTPLDASILAALTLKNPQEHLRQLEVHARHEGRPTEEHFWRRARKLLEAVLSPHSDPDEKSETPAVH